MSKYWLPPTDKRDIYELAFDVSKRELADCLDAWKQLEVKAQATLATAGIFEAAAFAYITTVEKPHWIVVVLLACLVASLAISVVQGLRAIRVVDVPTPYGGRQEYDDVLGSVDSTHPPDSLSSLYEVWLLHFLRQNAEASNKMHEGLITKGRLLKRSQFFLIIASTLVVPLTVCSLYTAMPD